MEKAIAIVENLPYRSGTSITEAANRMGYRVFFLGSQASIERNRGAALHRATVVDNWRTSNLRSLLLNLTEGFDLKGITSLSGLFTEHGLLEAQVSEISENLGLPHNDVDALYRSNNKFLMRSHFRAQGIRTVRFALVKSAADLPQAARDVQFPLIVKPIVGVCSSFIYRCNTLGELQAAFEHFNANQSRGFYADILTRHSYAGQIFDPTCMLLVEELIEGPELSVECLCTETEVHALIVHDKLEVELAAYTSLEHLLIAPPERVNEREIADIKSYAVQMLKALGLRNCFVHVELRLDSARKPSVIEVNPRVGGAAIPESFKTFYGIDCAEYMVRLIIGASIEVPSLRTVPGVYGMAAIFATEPGVVCGIEGIDAAAALDGVSSVRSHKKVGDAIGGNFEEIFVADAWYKATDVRGARETYKKIRDLVQIHVQTSR